MMPEVVIKATNIMKSFKLYYDRPETAKERLLRGMGKHREFVALDNVSFEIYKGSTVGFVGKNGCGKSTLLKIINRTMFPNSGNVEVKGKVSSLIELGAGFHPDLTGRENIYTNATIFGLKKQEIDERLPKIIAFSELGEFIDSPVRTYSSGMYARLAFSVAIHVDAEVLLVDEILGVGDSNFQAKCAAKIYEMRKSGMTIVIVSHDMGTVDRLCDYLIWLDHGKVMAKGEPKKVMNAYQDFMAGEQDVQNKEDSEEQGYTHSADVKDYGLGEHFGNGVVQFTSFKIVNDKGIEKRAFTTGEKVTILADYRVNEDINNREISIGIGISRADGQHIYGTNTARDGIKDIKLIDSGTIKVEFSNIALLPGEYYFAFAINDFDERTSYDHYPRITKFSVHSDIFDVGLVRLEHSFIVDGRQL